MNKRLILTALMASTAWGFSSFPSQAEGITSVCTSSINSTTGAKNCVPVSGSNPFPVSGSFSASLSGFQPTPAYAQLSVGASSARVALPTGTVVVVYNTGSNAAFVTLGDGAVTATAADDVIQPNSWIAFTVGAAVDLAAIETAGSTALNISGGSGLPTGAGGGGGSGAGGAVTLASGAVSSGAYASGAFSSGSISANAAASGAFPAGSISDLAHGQGAMAASVPVAIASNQSAVPISAASLPLPSGAATSANQPSNGAIGSTTSGQTGNLILGATTTAAPTYSTAQSNPLSLDTAGNLRVNVVTGGAAGGTSAADAAAWTAGSTSQNPIGCEFTTAGATAIVSAHMGAVGCTAARGLFSDIESIGGTGSFANYGSTPSAVPSIPVNAFVTNTNANGSAVSASSSPVVIASDQAAVAVKAASGAIASGALASGSVASGALAAGSISSGAAVSGAFATGAIADLALAQASTTSGQVGNLPLTATTTAAPTYTTAKSNPLSTTTAGALRVDGSAVTQPVSIASAGVASGAVASGAFASGSLAAGAIADGGDTTLGAKADAKSTATDTTAVTIMQVMKEISAMEQAPVGRSPYPVGATAETASATGTTAATTATLATGVGKTTYICSLSIRANATAAVTGNATVTGTITGTLNYTQWTAPLASGLGVTEEVFTPCVPASTTNTAIAVVSAAPGTGGVVSVSATGYQL